MRICAGLVALCLLLLPAGARAGEPVGAVREVKGSATILHAEESTPHAVAADAPVFPKDIIQSSDDAHMLLKFADGTELTLSGRGKLTVDDFVYDPKKPAENKSVFSLFGAAFSYVGGLVDKGASPNATLNLDYGSIGVRGTKIFSALAQGTDWIYLEAGKITIDNPQGQVILSPGEGTRMSSKAEAPASPYLFSADEIAWLKHIVDDPSARATPAMAANSAQPLARSRAESKMAAAEAPASPPAGGGGAANEMAADSRSLDAVSKAEAPARVAEPAAPAAPAEAAAPAAASVSVPAAMAEAEQTARPEILSLKNLSPATLGTRISADGETGIRIDTQTPTTINLASADISAQHLEDTQLRFHAQMKAKNLQGTAYLEMWVHFPGPKGGNYFSRGLDNQLTKEEDWKEFQTPFLLKKGQTPDWVTLNLVINGRGTVWIKDVHLER